MKKLNSNGIAHQVMLLVFVVVFAVAGVGYLVASHADSVTSAGYNRTKCSQVMHKYGYFTTGNEPGAAHFHWKAISNKDKRHAKVLIKKYCGDLKGIPR